MELINEAKRMQFLAGLITESQLDEVIDNNEDIMFKIGDIKSNIKKIAGKNSPDTSQTDIVKKEIETLIKEFVESPKTNTWQFFEDKKNDPKALEEAKREYIMKEIDERLSNFFFNSGSGSYVRMYTNPYKTWVVTEMKKVADALKLERLAGSLEKYIRSNG